MKCPECGGTGKVHKYFYEKTDVGKWEKVCGEVACEECDGTGKVEVTNEEWFCQLSTEEKATFLAIQIRLGVEFYRTNDERYQNHDWWEKWLKEKYREG